MGGGTSKESTKRFIHMHFVIIIFLLRLIADYFILIHKIELSGGLWRSIPPWLLNVTPNGSNLERY